MSQTFRTVLLVALATFAFALVIRLLGVNLRDPWLDEVYSQFAISREWYGLAQDRISRGHSPLYFALIKAFGIAGENVVAMRTASSVFDAAGGAILAGALARRVSLRAGFFFGVLYATSPVVIHWAQNARPYGLMMLFLAIGLVGAMGILSTLGRSDADVAQRLRRPKRMFAIGFSLSSLTLTAGVFSFIAIAALPFALPRVRADKVFLARWKRAIRWPGIVTALGYFTFSGPHIARQVDGYWAEKYITLSPDGLGKIWTFMLVDEGLPLGLSGLGLPSELLPFVIWAMSLALIAFVLHGALASRNTPALLAPVLLLVGYSLLLICVSAWTSVLVPRYFLPAWMCLLALAGVGMAQLSERRWSWLLIVPLLGLHGVAGLTQARLPGEQSDNSLQPVAALMAQVPPETLRVLYDKKNGSRNNLIMELLPLRFDRAELPRPPMSSFRLDRLEEAQVEGLDTFAYLTRESLATARADGADEPTCLHDFGDWVVAYWGERPEGCSP